GARSGNWSEHTMNPAGYEAATRNVGLIARSDRGLLVIRGAETDENFKPTSVAMERLLEDKIKYEFVEKTDVPDDLFKE
ncbi:MAG: hypothetical protein IH969_09900, partial [Candidatus Krumholzibacteriota bacterium]|nr:hypothetical protein [Candidatus Krumholzibacteriota bacterium]